MEGMHAMFLVDSMHLVMHFAPYPYGTSSLPVPAPLPHLFLRPLVVCNIRSTLGSLSQLAQAPCFPCGTWMLACFVKSCGVFSAFVLNFLAYLNRWNGSRRKNPGSVELAL